MVNKQKKGRSIYWTIAIPLIILLLVEASIIVGFPVFSGVFRELKENKENLLIKQVGARRDEIETVMAKDWSNLSNLASDINQNLSRLAAEKGMTVENFIQDRTMCDELVGQVLDEAVQTLYLKRASGIYMMLNGRDLKPLRRRMPSFSGLYVQDMSPDGPPAKNWKDLRLKRAPAAVVKTSGIEPTGNWKREFLFHHRENFHNYDFLYEPFQMAFAAKGRKDPREFGRWYLNQATWYDKEVSVATYSQPLITIDGMAYGVLGVDILYSHLQSMLPRKELGLDDMGSYILAKAHRNGGKLYIEDLFINSTNLNKSHFNVPYAITINQDNPHSARIRIKGQNYFVAIQEMNVYGNPLTDESNVWVLMGVANENALYSFSNDTMATMAAAVVFTLLCGLVGDYMISRRLSVPVKKVAVEASKIQTQESVIPQLPTTGIREVDGMSAAIVTLSQDVINTSTRFLKIIQMATGEIAGFEVQDDMLVFITDNFFTMLGMDIRMKSGSNKREFVECMEQIQKKIPYTDQDDGSRLYEVTAANGELRYISIRINRNEGTATGLAEDITALTVERQTIEYDRDYDLLTGLLNRRAFYREVEKIFYSNSVGNYAAVVMLDLDNLKQTNDKFGHEWGDRYLQKGAHGFSSAAPEKSVLSRLGGDEFVMFIYGAESAGELQRTLDTFREQVWNTAFIAPDGTEHKVQVSGGVSWYPRDSRHLQELLKFADFAMYEIKHSTKGRLGEFDFGSYSHAGYLEQNQKEFQQMLDGELVHYHFQPIFDAKTGQVFAYEALMRVNMPTLKTPDMVLQLAHQSNKLSEIERLTMLKSTEYFKALREEKLVSQDAYLFINSIADQWIEEEDQQRIIDSCGGFVSKIVMEITECMDLEMVAMAKKNKMKCFSGLFALDDYGTGYNGEKNLLNLRPKFVKLDICLIRGIDTDRNKQHIAENLLSFAHQRNMMVVAEGVETISEMHKCMELGVDLLQGFALARPASIPSQISPEALSEIHQFQKQKT